MSLSFTAFNGLARGTGKNPVSLDSTKAWWITRSDNDPRLTILFTACCFLKTWSFDMKSKSFAVHLVATAVTFSGRRRPEVHRRGATSRKYMAVHLLGNLVDSWLHKRGHKWKVSNEITQTRSILSDRRSGSNKRGLCGRLGGRSMVSDLGSG